MGANEGDDTITGGNGDDTLIGDTLEYDLLTPFVFTGVTQRNGIDYVVIGDSSANSIVWGNDSLTGGKGADNFVFTLFQVDAETLGTQGHDVITDLDRKVDILTFGNVADVDGNSVVDVADLGLVTTLSHVGGDTVINFNGSGSLTLEGVNIASLDDLNIQVLGTAFAA